MMQEKFEFVVTGNVCSSLIKLLFLSLYHSGGFSFPVLIFSLVFKDYMHFKNSLVLVVENPPN